MPRYTFSVHGNAFLSEQITVLGGTVPDIVTSLDLGSPRGWGRTFNKTGWYQVPLPSLMEIDGAPQYLEEVIILHSHSPRMRFDQSAGLWEGGNSLWTGLSVVPLPKILFRPRDSYGVRLHFHAGLCLSLHFTNSGDLNEYVTFHAATITVTDQMS